MISFVRSTGNSKRVATVQFLKGEGIATDEQLAPSLRPRQLHSYSKHPIWLWRYNVNDMARSPAPSLSITEMATQPMSFLQGRRYIFQVGGRHNTNLLLQNIFGVITDSTWCRG